MQPTTKIIYLDAEELHQSLSWRPLVDALKKIFCRQCHMPLRHHHSVQVPNKPDATLLLMPAWIEGEFIGVKLANVFPGNREVGLESVSASYLLSSAKTGEILALMDGGELTARRTAAASVLAAEYLAPKQARHHLMLGTGRLSINVIEAYARAFSIKKFSLWGRHYERAQQVASKLKVLGIDVHIIGVDDIDTAIGEADIISCATLAEQPLIKGEVLNPGTHVDLIGSFTPTMREADDDVIRRASVFVDTRQGASKESGDIIIPIQNGILSETDIQADLYDLCCGSHVGRKCDDEITVFKSVGAACEDLAAAILAYQAHVRAS